MKAYFAFCACLLLLVARSGAIPQTIQAPNIFLRSTGVSFEDFASDSGSWEAGGGLKGHWVARGDTLSLTEAAAVFGVAADAVTAQQKDGHIQWFRVLFRGGASKTGRSVDLAGQLTANVRAFTGDSGTPLSGGGTSFKYKAVTITLRAEAGRDVVVEFTRG